MYVKLARTRKCVKPLRMLKAIVIVVVTTVAYRLPTIHRLFDNSSTAASKTSTRATGTSGLKDDLDPPSERDDATTTNDNSAPCSFGVFRDHLLRSNTSYLTGDGRWTRLGGNNCSGIHNCPRTLRAHLRLNETEKVMVRRLVNGGHLHRFRPALCSLSHGPWLPRSSFANCLCRLNFTFIAIHGDSNAWRLFQHTNEFLVGDVSGVSATDSAAGGGGERTSNGGEKRGGIQCSVLATKNVHRQRIRRQIKQRARMVARSQRCNIVYQRFGWYLPPDYYRCRVACRGGELSVTVQYLPMTSDWTPYDEFVVPEETGCRNGAPSDGGNETASDRYFARRFSSYQANFLRFVSTRPIATNPLRCSA
jgi:hypothetical protein